MDWAVRTQTASGLRSFAAGARSEMMDQPTAGRDWAGGGLKRPSFGRPASGQLVGVPGLLSDAALSDPVTLPDAMSHMLSRLDRTTTSIGVCTAIVQRLPDAPRTLRLALVEVAVAADASGASNAYHDPSHSRDVGLIFANLHRMQGALDPALPFDAQDFLTGCCAAFGHDIGHDGQDGGLPFRLEIVAADIVSDIMAREGVAPTLIERVRCAILTTDVHRGYRALDDAQHGMFMRGRDEPRSLNALADFETRNMACLLRDSDVMQSAGLTPADHDHQTARLERERGMPSHAMGVRGADFFLRDLIRGRFLSDAGRVFQPRLDRLLRLNALRAQAGRESEGLATFDRA